MHQLAGVAQSVEQLTCNEKVEGSIPFSGTSNFGVWRSLVAHLVWDQGVQGSNPCTPTIFCWGLAQLVEQRVLIPRVTGSNPVPLAMHSLRNSVD
jgi:hypothetical protein